jgi:hypothetical protein
MDDKNDPGSLPSVSGPAPLAGGETQPLPPVLVSSQRRDPIHVPLDPVFGTGHGLDPVVGAPGDGVVVTRAAAGLSIRER